MYKIISFKKVKINNYKRHVTLATLRIYVLTFSHQDFSPLLAKKPNLNYVAST